MAITRDQHVAIWKHLLMVVLPKHSEDDNLWQLLGENGIDNVTDLMGDPATADEMASWEYEYASIDDKGDARKDASGNPIMIKYQIKRFEVNQVFILKDYIWNEAIKHEFTASSQMQHEHYIALTSKGYALLRTDPTYTMKRERILVDMSTTNAAGGNNTTNNPADITALQDFIRETTSKLNLSTPAEMTHAQFILDPDGVAKYQSLVGSMQWAISLGRFDIATACMTLSSFRSCPRIGHLERAKRVVGYLANMPDVMLRFRTGIPDFSDLPGFEYNWEQSIYGDVKEEIPDDAPRPLGKEVVFTHSVDANLYHDLITGRSVTGILHFVNQTPIDWYSKKQNKVETATYGSEFMAARTSVEQIMDIQLTFRYLGVPVTTKSYMFGDNEAVVNSAAKIDAKLHKRHNALSFHCVREAIASRMVDFYHIPGADNPADILSKHWSYGKIWKLLQPIMFWRGDTADIESWNKGKQKQ